MSTSYVPYAPNQDLLLPPSLQDWLPEDHLAYFISDTVDALDLTAFHARYANGGPRNQPFHPAMMVKVLLYGYASGTLEHNCGAVPEQTLADTGCRGEAVFEALADRGTDLIVSLGREGRDIAKIDATNKPRTAAMAEKLQSVEGQAAYRRRKHIVEPPNGWIKSVLGFRQFSLRGVEKVRAEWRLATTALNLRRMAYL
jgi:hypothetical protein